MWRSLPRLGNVVTPLWTMLEEYLRKTRRTRNVAEAIAAVDWTTESTKAGEAAKTRMSESVTPHVSRGDRQVLNFPVASNEWR